jgi:hypothetical protein
MRERLGATAPKGGVRRPTLSADRLLLLAKEAIREGELIPGDRRKL